MSRSMIYESGEYLDRNRGWHAEDSAWKAGHIAQAIGHLPHERICDIGCGAGEIIRELRRRFPESRFTGFELSAVALELARSRKMDGCEFFQGECPEALFGSFDIAMAIDVFEHVEDYFGFLRRMKRIATYKVLHIPLDMSALAVAMNNPMWARREVGHLHYFSKETALATLEECGFEIVSWKFTNSQILNARNLFVGGRFPRKLAKLVGLGIPRLALTALSPALSARLLGGLSLLVVAK